MTKSVITEISARGRVVRPEALSTVADIPPRRGHIASRRIAIIRVTVITRIVAGAVGRVVAVTVRVIAITVTVRPGRNGPTDDGAGREARGSSAPPAAMPAAATPAAAKSAAAKSATAAAPRHRLHARTGGVLLRRQRAAERNRPCRDSRTTTRWRRARRRRELSKADSWRFSFSCASAISSAYRWRRRSFRYKGNRLRRRAFPSSIWRPPSQCRVINARSARPRRQKQAWSRGFPIDAELGASPSSCASHAFAICGQERR